jgi:hypothetical protein
MCGNQELWRRKLSVLMDYDFVARKRDYEKAYKSMKHSQDLFNAVELPSVLLRPKG